MKVLILALVVLTAACSGSPTEPSSQPAQLVPLGNITTQGCFPSATPSLSVCNVFNGIAQNMGPGCATNVRGVITTHTVPGNTQIGSAPWTYAGKVRANEQIAFVGGPLTVGVPLVGGWSALNAIAWDSVAC